MISFNKMSRSLSALGGLLVLSVAPQLFAQSIDFTAGTRANEIVSNTATVNFTVGSVDQTVDSNVYEFVVDRVVDLTLTSDSASPVLTTPDASGEVTKYTLTNNSNDTLDFDLSAINVVGTDDQNADLIKIFIDASGTGNVGSYDAADTETSVVNDLAPGESVTIFVLVDVPSTSDGAAAGQIIEVELAAKAKAEDGSALVEATVNDDGLQTVFGDSVTTNTDGNPIITVQGSYQITNADLNVVKSSTVIEDPINGIADATTAAFAIPGATVQYCMVITNDGDADATGVELTDEIPDNTTYVDGSIAGGSGTDCSATPDSTLTTTGDTAGVSVEFGIIAADESVWARFQVTLD